MNPESVPVYMDHAATTPVDPHVAARMMEYLTEQGVFGNPSSSSHAYGREAAAALHAARNHVAALIGAHSEEIVFTSGATESDNLALLGVMRANSDRGRHLITARTEHKAVVDSARRLEKEGFDVSWLMPDGDGRIATEQLRAAIRPDTQLVSIMHANNETGVVQDVDAIGAICREHGVPYHTDAAQSLGTLAVDVAHQPIDLMSFTAHKIYGPKGIAALFVANAARPRLAPLLYGGGHERGLRPGTPATHQVVGFAAAAQLVSARRAADARQLSTLRDALQTRLLMLPGTHLNGHREHRLPGLLNISFEGVEGESLIADLEGELAVSGGAACDSSTAEPSYVLRALGRASQLAQSSLRFSLGRGTSAADVERAAAIVERSVLRLRAVAP